MPKPKQESIRELALEGNSQRKISKLLHVARNTVSKYVNADLDPRPAPKAAPKSPTMEPWADLVDEWLTQDLSMPKKQRHKATTVFERLRALGFRGSYSTVQRYVRHWRQEHPEPLARRGYLELEWAPGIAQADFGSAVVEIDGKRVDAHVLVLTFPHANARFCVGLPAERAECLCEGLLLIFEHIGGVPHTIVFDNASEAGRRMGDIVREGSLFTAFRQSLGFVARFTNPYAGHEKGSVENAVGYLRSHLMVPVPCAPTFEALNAMLLARCDALLDIEHYRHGDRRVGELFEADRQAMLPLPAERFCARAWRELKADKCGRVKVEGNLYLAGPHWAQRRMRVGLGAFDVVIEDEQGRVAARLPRAWDKRAETVSDPRVLVGALIARPGAWGESMLREAFPKSAREGVDELDAKGRSRFLRVFNKVADSRGFAPAAEAAGELFSQGREPDLAALDVLARRLSEGDAGLMGGPDLAVYDRMIGGE